MSRRRLFAASGATLAAGAPVALAACGTDDEDDEVTPEREAELLNAVLAQQLGVIEAVDQAASNAPGGLQSSLERLGGLRQQSARALGQTITGLDGTASDEPVAPAGGESPTEGVAAQLEVSIAASLDAIGELTAQTRLPVHRAIVEDAATLAAIRDALGEEPAPDAFVLGPPTAAKESS